MAGFMHSSPALAQSQKIPTFEPAREYNTDGYDPSDVAFPFGLAAGDFDNDGDLDVAVANAGTIDDFVGAEENGCPTGSVFIADGSGGAAHVCTLNDQDPGGDRYRAWLNCTGSINYNSTAVGQLNGGTKPDVVLSRYSDNQVYFMLGKGTGKFQHVPSDARYRVSIVQPGGNALSPVQALIVDLDEDGFGDIITANHESSDISVLINNMIVETP